MKLLPRLISLICYVKVYVVLYVCVLFTRRAQENDMIFMCVTKSVKPLFLDRDDGIRQ